MKQTQSRKQLGQLRVTYFLEGGKKHVFRGFFPVEGTVPNDVIIDSLARMSAEFFSRFADRMDSIDRKHGLHPADYFRGEIVDRFAELVKSYAGFSSKTPEELMLEWDHGDTEGGTDGR